MPARTDGIIRKRMQKTEFEANNNKWWLLEATPKDTYYYDVAVSFGRVGTTQKAKPAVMSGRQIDALIASKLRKGYVEVSLANLSTPYVPRDQGTPTGDPKVIRLIDLLFEEAGEHIKTYLATTVDALSQDQIARGRVALTQVADLFGRYTKGKGQPLKDGERQYVDAVKKYYNLIPTKLPRKLNDPYVMWDVAMALGSNLFQQEERLDQLEAALATLHPTSPSNDANSRLGSAIKLLPGTDGNYERIVRFMESRSPHHGFRWKVEDVYEVEVPSERSAYLASNEGKTDIRQLIHGTAIPNVRHIIHEKGPGSGLRIPTNPANGSMFGKGIYFADIASKSVQYAHAGRNGLGVLFLADVALGRPHGARAAHPFKEPPPGHDSVWGMAREDGGTLLHREFIVYKPHQQTIRYLVTFRRS